MALTFAFSLIAVAGLTGMSIDYALALNARTQLQDAADTAALASAGELEASDSDHVRIARDVFAAHVKESDSGISATPEVAVNGDTVTVAATAAVETAMLGVLKISEVDVGASATARKPRDLGDACVLALDPTKSGAVSLEGQSRLTASGCVVHANSDSDTALSATGTTHASADDHCAVGGHTGSGFVPTPESGCRKVEDPLAGLPSPPSSGCDHTNKTFTKGEHTARPGVYCGGVSFQAHSEVSLAPGVYVIKDGPLTARAHSSVSGDGVVFYLTGDDAVLDIRSGSTLDLTAPTSGDYAGLVFVQDETSSAGMTSLVEGGGSIKIVGGFYLPSQTLDIGGEGDIGALSPFMPLIADDITIRGNADLSVSIDNAIAGMPDYLPAVWSGVPRLIS